jgi:DNA-directed RNA polymerase subunit B
MEKLGNTWALVEAFVAERGVVRQHLDSYNDFVENRLQKIVDEVGGIDLNVPENIRIKFGKISLGEPVWREADASRVPLTPQLARLRNLTYAAPLILEMSVVRDGSESLPEKVTIGYLPLMVKSKFCVLYGKSPEELVKMGEDPLDPGGYFIVNGTERVIVAQEDLVPNKILTERDERTGADVAKVFSTYRGFRSMTTVERRKDGLMYVHYPAVPGPIPLVVMMRALGLISDREIVEAISRDPEIVRELYENLQQSAAIRTREDALDFIGKRVAVGQPKAYRLQRAEEVLDKYFLPHLGTTPDTRRRKAYYLGIMAQRAIELALGRRTVDDKDNYANKRLRLAGDLLEAIFRLAFANLLKDIQFQLERSYSRGRHLMLETSVRTDVLTERLLHSLATGNWPGGRTGISQLLDRTCYVSTLSHLRRVVSPLSRSQPHFEARDLHPTHWGRICPVETPEGPNCGLVKNLALLVEITTGTDPKEVIDILPEYGVKMIEKGSEHLGKIPVYVNGSLVGAVEDGEKLVNELRKARRQGKISSQVNIAYRPDTNEISITTDEGRIRRPLIVVENGKPKLTRELLEKVEKGEVSWSKLVEMGVVEYLDPEEEENALIAVRPEDITPKTTHLELHPAVIFGVSACVVPYAEHNQSPRNVYAANMAKQAIGVGQISFHVRVDTRGHLLSYPQLPLCQTKAMNVIGYNQRPAGQNLVVAIACYGGYNMEDAIIANRDSIQRGMGRSTCTRLYEAEAVRYPGGQMDKIEVPSEEIQGFADPVHYKNLGKLDGLAELETEVKGEAVLIGKTSPPRFFGEIDEFGIKTETERRETSVRLRPTEEGIVDQVFLTVDGEGNKLARVRVREMRVPEIGDKFASRHGQKGVLGIILDGADMPFTEDGIVPDIIINPHAIPSRMSLGQLLEMLACKAGALRGRFIDGTPFDKIEESELKRWLKELGFNPSGKEILYDGITGEMIPVEIFIGPCYYEKLHHMAADKIHSRARGPVQILTHQPTEGRAREGGLRFGEMERDCLLGHGAAMILKDRLLYGSDKYTAYVCGKCGNFVAYDPRKDTYLCPMCHDEPEVYSVEMPYTFKILLDELRALALNPRIRLKERV